MNNYETIFIMKDDITEEQRNEVINKIKDYLNINGKITNTTNMGLRKFAYEIRKYKQGYYYVIEFDSEASAIAELERIYRITDEILKFIVVRKDD